MADPLKRDHEKTKLGGPPLDTRSSRSSEQAEIEHQDRPEDGPKPAQLNLRNGAVDDKEKARLEDSRKMANPLAGLSHEKLSAMGEKYARFAGLDSEEDLRAFRLGAIIAGDENQYDTVKELTAEERESLDREVTHRWSSKIPNWPPLLPVTANP